MKARATHNRGSSRGRLDGRIDDMAADKEKRDYRDRERINVHEEYEVRYRKNHAGGHVFFDISPRLSEAVVSAC
jgi:hypothetical protein